MCTDSQHDDFSNGSVQSATMSSVSALPTGAWTIAMQSVCKPSQEKALKHSCIYTAKMNGETCMAQHCRKYTKPFLCANTMKPMPKCKVKLQFLKRPLTAEPLFCYFCARNAFQSIFNGLFDKDHDLLCATDCQRILCFSYDELNSII